MACFLAPAAEAVVTTAIKCCADKKEKKNGECVHNPFIKKLNWLNNMLWGGSALLAFEHLWHGEIKPWFPFLTKAADPTSAAEMLREIATSGTAMALLVTVVWVGIVCAYNSFEKQIDDSSADRLGTVPRH